MNLAQACHSHLLLAKRFGLMFEIDLPMESQNTRPPNRSISNENNPFIHTLDKAFGCRGVFFHPNPLAFGRGIG